MQRLLFTHGVSNPKIIQKIFTFKPIQRPITVAFCVFNISVSECEGKQTPPDSNPETVSAANGSEKEPK